MQNIINMFENRSMLKEEKWHTSKGTSDDDVTDGMTHKTELDILATAIPGQLFDPLAKETNHLLSQSGTHLPKVSRGLLLI
jgi:hypothetical protein